MALSDFITKKNKEVNENEVVTTFESSMNTYPAKTVNWHVRITAEELGIPKDIVCEVLDKHYAEEEDAGQE